MLRKQDKPKTVCYFCSEKKTPDFLDSETLMQFLSERGKILSRERTENCAKHQRVVSRELKRARFLSLLPYVVRPE